MSDISRELVKCAKCGKESQQLIVYSVNYYLEGKENGDKLLHHKQKCPYCNYEAIDLSKNKLIRKELADKFYGYHSKNKINSSDLTINYLNELQNFLKNYNYENDTDFVMEGRKKFVYDEIMDILNGTQNVNEPLYFVLGSLEEFISNNNFINPSTENYIEVREKNDRYSNKGIICLEEKKYIDNIIEEIKKYIKSLEDNDMGLFSKKDKYEINEKDNVPQFVYGIPDSMRKQWEKEKEEKRKNQKTIFSAFEGGYFGPSYYYFVNNYKDSYEFRVGYSKDGRFVKNDENDPNIHIFEQNGEHYKKFMEELLPEIKEWNETYNDPEVMDGIQWNIELIEQNKKYSGSNAFPQNYDKVVAILKKYFNVDYFIKDNEKYDIKPEDNVPYEVYGIPDFKKKNYDVKPEENVPQRVYGVPNAMLNNNDSKYDIKPENNVPQRVYGVPNTNIPKPSNNSVIKKSVGVGIKNEKSNYVLSLNYAEKLGTYDLLFADLNNLENKSISDLATPVPEKYYTDFITKLYSIINDWENNYSGDSNVSWNIKIDDEKNQKTISGKGGFPKNWNKLIDLLSEYERLFKVSKDIELGKIQDMKDAKLSFEEVVRNKVSDPFWVETIVKHFKEEEKMNDVVSKILFKDLSKYDDILNEFTKYLTQRTYDIDGAIEINGYTAKKVAELNPAFHATGVYTFMELLRDDFAKAEEIIKGGFKNKDVVPPTIKKDSNSEEEMLKEIEDEVDKEMIELGLLTIKDGRKIPAFGSCHTRWGIEKRILKERYNYDYKTPAEKNPFINFD